MGTGAFWLLLAVELAQLVALGYLCWTFRPLPDVDVLVPDAPLPDRPDDRFRTLGD